MSIWNYWHEHTACEWMYWGLGGFPRTWRELEREPN